MKSFIVAACIVACAYAVNVDQDAQVEKSDYNLTPEGNYRYLYEGSNGISGEASGSLKTFGNDAAAVVVSGSNSYVSPEGEKISLTYIADENGYQPSGSHLPTPPAPQAIPDYILKSIEYIAAHPYVENKKN